MNRHVFVTLAAVLGVVVHGLPQHRFQPYQFSYSAGKPSESVSLGVGSADPTDPVFPAVESAQSPDAKVSSPVVDPSPIVESSSLDSAAPPMFQDLWKKAAQNLVNIPHLLHWVSSLRAETLMTDLIQQQQQQQQQVVQTQDPVQYEEIPLPEPVIQSQPEEIPIVEAEPTTEFFDFTTTENYVFEETTAAPEMIVIEPQPVEAEQPQTVQEFISTEPEVINQEPVVYEPEQIAQEVPVYQPEQVQEETIYADPEPVEMVQPDVEMISQPEPVPEIFYPEPEPVQDVIYVEPEPVPEVVYNEPEPVYTEPEPRTRFFRTRPKPTARVPYTQPEPQVQQRQSWEPQVQQRQSWEPQVQQRQSWQPQIIQTYEKVAPVEAKKPTSKFRYNRFNSRKQSQKKGKTLNPFQPMNSSPSVFPASEPFSSFSDGFTFPAYSYSISHQPSSSRFQGRR